MFRSNIRFDARWSISSEYLSRANRDEKALADRLRSGRLGGAAMDVFAKEPAKDLSHFAGIENIFLTPHISGVTVESNDRVCDVVTRLVDQALGKFA
ncbi:MAG: hypothetical protein EBQ70_09895 [Betaproteobacteria bacterium]|nr:hypothetical protein [Betaproteobacteria bacterium]